MELHALAQRVGGIEPLDRVAGPATRLIGEALGQGGVKDLLSGTWLGHPAHPMLTDVPIGSLTSATVLDLLGGRRGERGADLLMAVGLVSAIPTAAAGAADWSDTSGRERRVGLAHALANALGLAFYAGSVNARRRGHRRAGKVLALAGMTSMTGGGYLGGYLGYSRGVGVNNSFTQHEPEEWTSVLALDDLPDSELTEVQVPGATVVILRSDGQICAIGSRCSHAGRPLAEGSVDTVEGTVRCPWHQSVFRLADGTVVHGPASVPQASYEVSVEDRQIRIRHRTA